LQLRKLKNLTKMSHNEMPDIHSFDVYLACAHALADTAAGQTLQHFRRPTAVENKARAGGSGAQKSFDPVTAADRGAEKAIRAELAERFPDHGIHGEEFGLTLPDARHRWVVDPIDGTAAFIMGWPMWGTLISLTDNGRPLLGLLDQPFTRERFWSTSSEAVWRGPDKQTKTLRTRPCASVDQAALSTTHPDYFSTPQESQAFARVKQAVRTTRYGGDCYAYAMLASGFCDLIIESGLQAYDVAALIPIVEKAGGVITTWSGEPAGQGGNIVAAGDVRLHQAALELLSN
jgi:histidinol-phosphatase